MHKKTSIAIGFLAAAGMLIVTLDSSVAGTPQPCQVLPAATVQSILGSPVQSHAPPEPATVAEITQFSCFYVGPNTNASLQIADAHSASAAAAAAARVTASHARYGLRGTLVGHKGSYIVTVGVRKPSDYGKLRALLSAALRNI